VLLDRLVDADLSGVRKNATLATRLHGMPVRLARTGYTGEDGFEVFVRPEDAVAAWTAVTAAGAVPCGLGARDTLRLEAGFPLFGHELGPDTDPRCTPFSWVVKDKPFAGDDAYGAPSCSRRLVGLRLTGRGVARQGYRVQRTGGGEVAGEVTSGTVSPLTRDSIAFAWVDADLAEPGREVAVEIRAQQVSATVVDLPFFAPDARVS
jgi:aminomethyltransferase